MLGVHVDLVLCAVQPEADRALGAAAVNVVDEQGLHLLGHGRSVPPVAGAPSWTRQVAEVRIRTGEPVTSWIDITN
jgi:hypothetical protein